MQQAPLPAPPTILVKDPLISQQGSFHTYLVTGKDQHGEFYTRRRFNDFVTLHERMKKEWPGCYIPSLPNKKLIGNREPAFVEHRRRFLQYFCAKIATIEHLYEGEHFQLLLRYPDTEIEKGFDGIQEKSTATMVKKYQRLFGDYLHKTPLVDLNTNITKFHGYVQKAQKLLKVLDQETIALTEAKSQFQEALNNANILLMPAYESQLLSSHLQDDQRPHLHPMTNNPEVSQSVRSLQIYHQQNSLDFFCDMIQLELRELEVMDRLVDSLNEKKNSCEKLKNSRKAHQDQLSKLMSGKTTLKSVFNFASKEDQKRNLEVAVEFQHHEIEALEALIEYMVMIIGGIEIETFKTAKRVQYYENMNIVSKMEIRNMAAYGALQRSIAIALDPLQQHLSSELSGLPKLQPPALQQQTPIREPTNPIVSPQKRPSEQQQVQSCHMSPTLHDSPTLPR